MSSTLVWSAEEDIFHAVSIEAYLGGPLGHGPLFGPKFFFLTLEKNGKTWLAPSFVWALVASENLAPSFSKSWIVHFLSSYSVQNKLRDRPMG